MTDETLAAPSPADSPASSNTPADTSASSPAPAAETQASATSGENTASPPDAPVNEREGLLAAVRKVVEPSPKNPLGEGTPVAPETKVLDPAALVPLTPEQLEADPTEEELKGVPARTKARMDKLLADRRALRTENEALKPDVERWRQMNGYLTKHDLSPADVNLLLGTGAALRRGDFKAFRDGIMPYVELCNRALGHTIDPDLQAKADAGEITVEAARELSVTRFANTRLTGEAKARTTADTSAAQQEQAARTAQAVSSAVTTWEQGIRGRDPDYAKKESAVRRISQALIAEHGRPRTAEDAVKLATTAYEEASRMFAAALPAPVPTKPQPSGSRAVNGVRPEPKTLMEAARLGLERSRK